MISTILGLVIFAALITAVNMHGSSLDEFLAFGVANFFILGLAVAIMHAITQRIEEKKNRH